MLEHATRYGTRAALIDGATGETITYGDLRDHVDGAARVLIEEGVGPGTTVALMSVNQPWWVIAFHAVLSAGAAVTPLNPALTVGEINDQLRAAGVSLLIADSRVLDKAIEAGTTCGAAVMTIGAPVQGGRPLDRTPRARAHGAATAVPVDRLGAVAVLPFSSGTTGLPKGVMLTHRNLVANICQHAGLYHVGVDDVFLAVLPFFHIYGITVIMNYGLRHGATIVTLPRFDPARYLAAITRYQVTWLHLAPPMVLCLADTTIDHATVASVRHALSGAAPLDGDMAVRAEARIGCRIGQGYGMTEASPGVTFAPDDHLVDSPPGSVGVLVAGTEARVVDPVLGTDVDGDGELWVRGPQVMVGYLDDPAATAASVTSDGWLRTGDIVRVDAAGHWRVVDRLKELIKYKGYQVAPAELEAVLLTHPGIADAAVVGLADPAAGEIPKAFVVGRSGEDDLDSSALMSWVAERVAPYKKVRAVEFVARIPRSASGKILRRELRDSGSRGH